MKLQYQLSTGLWLNCENRTYEFLEKCVKNNAHQNITTMEQVIEALSKGKSLRNSASDWYSNCRDIEAIESLRAEYLKQHPPQPIERVKCFCGHIVPKESVMNASLGTSCPSCYDKLSD